MPFCEPCDRFYNPNSVQSSQCPECGEELDSASEHPNVADGHLAAARQEDEGSVAPWHFWVMVALLSIYLGWRVVQGIISLFT